MEKKKWFFLIVVVLTVAFIFGQSMLDQPTSQKESSAVQKEIVEPIHEALTGEKTIRFKVRKAAHMIEFAVLGLELALFLENNKWLYRGAKAVSYCGFTALLDESNQYISGRTPQVSDVWLDILGSGIGIAVGFVLILLFGLIKRGDRKSLQDN